MGATSFIAISKAAKEALRSATLLRTLNVSAIIRGEPGVGRRTLARYILPNTPIIEAKEHQEILALLSSSSQLIISHLESAANIEVLLQEATKHDVRLIATAAADYEDARLRDFFGIEFTIPPLRERLEDVAVLQEQFKEEIERLLGRPFLIDMESFRADLSKNAYSLKKQMMIHAVFGDVDAYDIMELMYNYLYDRLGGSDDYKRYLYLYEVPLIKAGLKRFSSQTQLAQKLGLNRNTLRKKIATIKEYL